MNRKTAIIVGVVILILTSIITPFILRKINKKAENSIHTEKINSVSDNQNDDGFVNEITLEKLSGDSNTEEEQVESGDIVEKYGENEVLSANKTSRNKSSLNSSERAATQTTTNKTKTIEEKGSNETVNTTQEVIENAISIDVSNLLGVSQENTIAIEDQVTSQEQVMNALENVPQANIELPEGTVGILKIDKLGLNQKVADGHSLEVLKANLGHVDNTAYATGNVGILGHNSGNAGYFKNLWDLKKDDVIEYTTANGIRTYKVSEVVQIADNDWSMLSNTTDNRITLITCVKNVPEKRWCIQGVEI